MDCSCMIKMCNYDIELIQGDYSSFLYTITDNNDEPLNNINKVIFSCKRLKSTIELIKITNSDFALIFSSDITSTFSSCVTTYDITIMFKNEQTPITVVYDATLTILRKENKI